MLCDDVALHGGHYKPSAGTVSQVQIAKLKMASNQVGIRNPMVLL